MNFNRLLICGVLVVILVIPYASASKELSEPLVIRAIIGEASSEGYRGMLAVAEAIRNRGHLGGVYGVRAGHVDREPPWVWERARRAWTESATSNLVKGADHWHNVEREGHTYWTKVMTKTVKIDSHTFYK